jgi:hypothetical protein
VGVLRSFPTTPFVCRRSIGLLPKIAVGGFSWTGVDLSTAVAYTFDRVLKAVGDLTSTAAAIHLEVRPVEQLAAALICRDNLGLLGGLDGDVLDMAERVGHRTGEGLELGGLI